MEPPRVDGADEGRSSEPLCSSTPLGSRLSSAQSSRVASTSSATCTPSPSSPHRWLEHHSTCRKSRVAAASSAAAVAVLQPRFTWRARETGAAWLRLPAGCTLPDRSWIEVYTSRVLGQLSLWAECYNAISRAEAEDGLSLPASSPHHRRITHTHTQTHPHQHRRSAHCTSTVAATHKTPRECGGGGSHRLRLHSRSWFSARRGDVRCGDALRVERVILHTNCTQTVPYGYPSPAVAVCTVPSGSGPKRRWRLDGVGYAN